MDVKGDHRMTWTSSSETARFRQAMEEQQRQRLAAKITAEREYRGWTEAKLAQESGVSIETISRLENAKTENPRDLTIASLAEAFGKTSDELAGPRLSPEAVDELTQTQLDRIEAGIGHLADLLADLIDEASQPKRKPSSEDEAAGGE